MANLHDKTEYFIHIRNLKQVFIVQVNTDDINKSIAEGTETRFDTLNFELDKRLSKGKNKKVIGLMKDELGGQTIKEFVGLNAKTYSYLLDNKDEDKRVKCTKQCAIK